MNEKWIDEYLKMLSSFPGLFNPNSEQFYFEPTKRIYQKLESGEEKDLQDVTTEISQYLGIFPAPVAKYEWGIKMELEHAGDYLQYHIRIPFHFVGNKYAVGSILAHEITHAFLELKGIRLKDKDEHERLTDLGTIYIGLGKLTINGLRSGVGYLPQELKIYAYKKIAELRSISKSAAMENLDKDAKAELIKIF